MNKAKLIQKVIFLFLIIASTNVLAQSNFIRLENGNFKNGSNNFRPYSVNYVFTLSQDCNTSNYFAQPCSQYSIDWGYPHTRWLKNLMYDCNSGRNYYSSTDERGVALQKFSDDMEYLSDKGFNVIRVADIDPKVDPVTNQVEIPTGSYSTYFNLVEQLLDTLESHGLKAIINFGIDSNIKELEHYCEFLENFSSHFRNNTTIMAYSLLSEPFYGFQITDRNDKIQIGNWVNEMYYTIKRSDQNHLVTIGLQHPETVINWDYGMMMVDFISLHLYAWSEDVNYSNRMISKYYKFLSNNYSYPWVISETGFSGTDTASRQDSQTGTEQEQLIFANYNIQRAQDCGCKGYGWWAHQDLGYGSNWEENLGFVTRWPEEYEKDLSGAFNNMDNIIPNSNNCSTPSNYLNIDEGNTFQLMGYVKDENGNPIKDALVYGYTYSNGNFRILTDAQGKFMYYNKGGYPYSLWISAIGYDVCTTTSTPQNNKTYILRKINKNNWTKRFTNNTNNTLLDWTFNDFDRFFAADFDGDGKEEFLCIQVNDGGNCKVNIYEFDNGKWSRKWTNNSNNAFGGWSIRSFDKYLVGDFDGDGKDEIQCMQLTDGSYNWSTTLEFYNGYWRCDWTNNGASSSFAGWWLRSNDDFIVGDFDGDSKDEILCYQRSDMYNCYATILNNDNNSWSWGWSNNGNDFIGGWRLCSTDKVYAGDLDGDQKDELICAQTGGSNDWITIQNFDNNYWNTSWSNSGDNTVGIYPYRSKLIIGNFDFDDKDEILGVYTSATKFDFDNNFLNLSWSTGGSTLSDWNVNYNANCFFIHSIESAPDYLFTIEEKDVSYSAEMFSMNVLVQGDSFPLKSGKTKEQNEEKYLQKVEDKIKVYPNPTNNSLKIELPDNQLSNIELIDINGKILKSIQNIDAPININVSHFNPGVYILKVISSEKSFQQKIVISR